MKNTGFTESDVVHLKKLCKMCKDEAVVLERRIRSDTLIGVINLLSDIQRMIDPKGRRIR